MHTRWPQFVPNMSTRHPRTLNSTSQLGDEFPGEVSFSSSVRVFFSPRLFLAENGAINTNPKLTLVSAFFPFRVGSKLLQIRCYLRKIKTETNTAFKNSKNLKSAIVRTCISRLSKIVPNLTDFHCWQHFLPRKVLETGYGKCHFWTEEVQCRACETCSPLTKKGRA